MAEKDVSGLYEIPGEYKYKGVVHGLGTPIELLYQIKEFAFRPDDILLAVYPKCGKFITLHILKNQPRTVNTY